VGAGYTAPMKRLVAALGLVLIAALSPASAWAQPVWPGMGSPGATPAHRPHSRPGPPFIHRPSPVFGCCLGFPYVTPPPPPPVIVVPSVLYVVPSPPTLLYVPPARPEPAPEITLATGRWERHGNGVEYPYTWVWVGAAPAR
jgi:hypothetical protein